ncbi:hypothetical protein A2625_07010 [candidate division WOR-1 bacterium RIFCSPHIGHO2_01_FULL_53_15]|uniref:Yip1 domain-containing protein n=1 Tax=candidate division WOR-1 bacterium RIFCSPHIGHO2_01_FULL_53_15 TaxID=1802564 RepID=A0A1F4Q482_UNCSA|nr:MAG: hypothetical protein A2625_07010 [candidate division WOR-1 bacterium RIFCSPHIGHO2_01_FULL_53_15]OGC13236.1 MAG: hypothetical protein A3D23_01260 [candidate division WOR-1 bacterium RIFCSPHIGHO2_02_FULL_53_26]
MIKALKEYFVEWWIIIARPILFYTKLKEESWKEQSLTFLLFSSWILAAAFSLAIFIVQYLPIGATLVTGIIGFKFLLITPVILTLAFAFYMITLLIVGGVLSILFGAAFYAIGFILHYIYLAFGGQGRLNRMIQSSFYSSAVVLFLALPAAFAVVTRYGWLELSLFAVGFNIVYVFIAVYVYGLWAVAGRKTYGVAKWRAFAGALVPVVLLLIFGFIFDKIGLRKLEAWIAPLK